MKNKRLIILPVFFLLVLVFAASFAGSFEIGKTYHGFRLEEKRFVEEVNAECYLFRHLKSGARLLKIAADDPNKTFSVSFKTVPQSDAGTPHIMEHCVLNGSKNFPVKSPFDVLAKGSLNTFLNAMTGSDRTIYPVASMNMKDYFNLMHVYLDAVFFPLIYDDPRIFKQEGWHYELTGMDEPVVYKGVVYNEMKGAFSSPGRELGYQISKHLFPDNAYGLSSGGYPSAIPTLTYEEFLDFHRTLYHPSNSYIFIYGDADLEEELAFIDSKYLSKFEDTDVQAEFKLQKPFPAMKKVMAPYAVPEGAPVENQTFLSLTLVAGRNTDQALVMALDVLADVLVNHESAPIRLALQEAGIGKDVNGSSSAEKQNTFQIIATNANPGEQEKFLEIVMNTIRDVAEKGLDREMVEGVINRMEFRLREGDSPQKGLMYNMQALTGWFFAQDPFLSLEYEKPLAKVKAGVDEGYLETIIKEYLLDNPHSLLLTLEPEPGLEKEIKAKTEAELAAYKASLSDEEKKDLVEQTRELIQYQQREDSPEALATIPLLDLSDIDPDIEWYGIQKMETAGVPVLHHEAFTNNIVYVSLNFDLRVLPQELIPYAGLLAEFMGSLNTENYSYGDLDNALNIHTGGFSTGLSAYLENLRDEGMLPVFNVSSKALNEKTARLFELAEEVIIRTRFNDPERLQAVLARHQARVDYGVKQNGFQFSLIRLMSYFSRQGLFTEKTRGLDYYWFITDLSNNFEEKSAEIIVRLQKTADLLFTRENMLAAVTCSKDDLPVYSEGLETFAKSLPVSKAPMQSWVFDLAPKNEGLLAASKVQYVVQGYDFKKLGYDWNGKIRVLNQVLSTDWLQTQVRVIGGAYGGFSSFTPSGLVFLGSYRDPNLTETLETYKATPDYLRNFQADEQSMTRYIIGTVSGMDRPMTASQKGAEAVRYYLEKITPEDLEKERQAVLSTTPEDIRKMSSLVQNIVDKNVYCVYGNEDKVRSAAEKFGELVELSK